MSTMSKLDHRYAGTRCNEAPLVDLLAVIGSEITRETLKKLRVLLRGHIDKDVLDYVETGSQLLQILYERGLVTNGRLAFLRKLLSETRCFRLVSYLDGYKDKKRTRVWADEGFSEMSSRQSCKERRLQGLIGRIENEIKLYEDNKEKTEEVIKEIADEIKENKQTIVTHEEHILKTKSIRKKEQLNLQSVERRLEDIKYFIRKLYREEESLSEKLKSTRQKKTVRDELIAKHAEIKDRQLMEGEFLRKYENISENIRLSYTDLRNQTTEMMEVERKMQEDTSRLRSLKKEIIKHSIASKQLKEMLIALKQELAEFNCTAKSPCSTEFVDMSSRDLEQYLATPEVLAQSIDSAFKIVDFNGLIEHTDPLVIGCKGKKSDPPNFRFPCSIALDQHDNIYIADSRNRRVQVLHIDGSPARKPIEVGNFQPCAIAVSSTGKIFISNSHLIWIYSSDGEPLNYILPIYGNSDIRPEITGLAITSLDDTILFVDKANQRIQKFRQDGTFLSFIGGNHLFESPFGIAVAKNGDIMISESDAHHIKIFEGENGPLKKKCGTKGIGKGKLLYPRGIATDNNKSIFVADSGSHQVKVINTKDQDDASFGSFGNMPGFFDTPYDVSLTNDGKKVVVVEARNHRLQIFTKAVAGSDFRDSSCIAVTKEDCCDSSDNVKELTRCYSQVNSRKAIMK